MADISQIKLPNGSIYDIKDEVSGYITLNDLPIDQEIPVSRIGDVEIGDTVGTESTNLPTSKAVVDYVEERLEDEIGAIDIPVESVNGKTGQVVLTANDVGAASQSYVDDAIDNLWIPTSTSQLTNDSGFITSYKDEKLKTGLISTNTMYYIILDTGSTTATTKYRSNTLSVQQLQNTITVQIGKPSSSVSTKGELALSSNRNALVTIGTNATDNRIITLPDASGTVALTSDIPAIPTNISAFTNDSGYLTSSDIASVLTYKGTKTSVANLPSTGNKTGDVWHITADGSEYAWDGSIWQELGTAIDLSGYVPIQTTDGAGQPKSTLIRREADDNITLGAYYNKVGDFLESKIAINSNSIVVSSSGSITFQDYNDGTGYYSPLMVISTANSYFLNLRTPISDSEAANKKYVDDKVKAITATDVGALPDNTVIPSKVSDLTNDLGFITNYTDEKVKAVSVANDGNLRYLIFGNTGGNAETKYYHSGLAYSATSTNKSNLTIGDNTYKGTLRLSRGGGNSYYATIDAGTSTANSILTLPNKDGTIALVSDIPITVSSFTNDAGYLTSYTETDPVFSASAAAGITSTDISNWNGKSSTDEKVKAVSVTNDGSTRYLVFGSNTGNAETKYYSDALRYALLENNYALFSVGDTYHPGRIHIESGNRNTGNGVNLITSATTGRTITFPDKTGTVAMTSDIPQAYSSTNTGGYLTMATLPIYDGTVV